MKISIKFENTEEEDGVEGTTTLVRENISDLYSLAYFFTEATIAAGFTYCKSVGIEKDDGTVVFGDV